MASHDPNPDIEQPIQRPRRRRRIADIPDRTHPEPGDAVDRANDADLVMDEQEMGGDQDIDTAGIPDVDTDAAHQPDRKPGDRRDRLK